MKKFACIIGGENTGYWPNEYEFDTYDEAHKYMENACGETLGDGEDFYSGIDKKGCHTLYFVVKTDNSDYGYAYTELEKYHKTLEQ